MVALAHSSGRRERIEDIRNLKMPSVLMPFEILNGADPLIRKEVESYNAAIDDVLSLLDKDLT